MGGEPQKGVPHELKAAAVAVLLPALEFVVLEGFLYLPWPYMYIQPFLMSVAYLMLANAALALCLRSLRAAYMVSGAAVLALGTASRYLYLFRGRPFFFSDLAAAGTAAQVAGRYDFTPDAQMLASWACCLLWLAVAFMGWREYDGIGRWFRHAGLGARAAALAACGTAIALCTAFIQADYADRVEKSTATFAGNGSISMVRPDSTRRYVGSIYDWIGMPALNSLSEPDGYGAWEGFEDSFAPADVPLSGMPDVVVIMDEAFSDPDDYGGAHALTEYMPFLKSFQGMPNARYGSLDVSVIAGNTCNTEFEALLGTSMACFDPSSTPYSYALTRDVPSLARYFSEMGYETWACHPHGSGNWGRADAYRRMGFDRLLFMDMPCEGVSFPDTSATFDAETNNEDLLSDEACYDVVSQILDKRNEDGVPRFIFVVTIQNHGGYFRHFEGLEFDVRVTEEAAAAQSRPDDELAMVKYLSLMKRSDEALEGFCGRLSERESRTGAGALVAFFGDHQPDATAHMPFEAAGGIDRGSLTPEQLADFYKVPYGLWATYALPEGMELGRKGACYVGVDLFCALGRGEPAYYSFLGRMLGHVPVHTGIRTETDGTEEADALIRQFGMLQWQRISDPGYTAAGREGGGT